MTKWYNTETKKPENGKRILLVLDWTIVIEGYYWKGEYFYDKQILLPLKHTPKVTHWGKLPKPPKRDIGECVVGN